MAADHQEIASCVRGFGGKVVMTDPQAASGTDRVAEVARSMPDMDIFVNVQGDEPEISGQAIDLAIDMLERDRDRQSWRRWPLRFAAASSWRTRRA